MDHVQTLTISDLVLDEAIKINILDTLLMLRHKCSGQAQFSLPNVLLQAIIKLCHGCSLGAVQSGLIQRQCCGRGGCATKKIAI